MRRPASSRARIASEAVPGTQAATDPSMGVSRTAVPIIAGWSEGIHGGEGAQPSDRRAVHVAERPAALVPYEEADPALPALERVVGGVGGTDQLAIELVEDGGESSRAVRLALVDRLERHRREAGGQHRHRGPASDLAGEPPDRDARHHAPPCVEGSINPTRAHARRRGAQERI